MRVKGKARRMEGREAVSGEERKGEEREGGKKRGRTSREEVPYGHTIFSEGDSELTDTLRPPWLRLRITPFLRHLCFGFTSS